MGFEYLGPYKVTGELGRGGMGTVLRGQHSKTKQVVAIKVIATALADQERFRRRFDAEIETLKRLKHENIVELIGFGEEQGHLFYSMEIVEGETLQELLRREKKIGWQQTLKICIEICSALKHAHDFGVIHRDLKPANIMLDAAGTVKLTDFGIAKIFGASDSTAVGSVIGTADFMPPEQAEGKTVTTRSDLYAVGAIAYACLTGRPPFLGKNLPEVLHAVRYDQHKSIEERVSGVPSEIGELIDELLAKSPQKRPPTALVVGNRFRSLASGLQKRAAEQTNRAPTAQSGKTGVGSSSTHVRQTRAPQKDVSSAREVTSIDISELTSPAPAKSQGRPKKNSEDSDTTHVITPEEAESLSAQESISDKEPSIVLDDAEQGPVGPDDATILATPSRLNATASDRSLRTSSGGDTSFTTVDGSGRTSPSIFHDEPAPHSAWTQWVSIGLITVLLALCGIAVWRFARPASANELYGEIEAAIDLNDPSTLLANRGAVEEFMERFPNDQRIDAVRAAADEIETQSLLRAVRRRARTQGRENLPPMEQAILDCMDAMEISGFEAGEKLQAFVAVFGVQPDLTAQQKTLLALGEELLADVRARGSIGDNPNAELLFAEMNWARDNLSPAARDNFYRGIVELYENKSWADSAVSIARKRLEE